MNINLEFKICMLMFANRNYIPHYSLNYSGIKFSNNNAGNARSTTAVIPIYGAII